MHPQIAAIVADFEAARARLRHLVDRTAAEAWSVRPAPERWSADECVAHLNLTARAFLPLLRAALAEARALGGTAPARLRRDPVGWLISTMSGPMRRVGRVRVGRVRTASAFVPTGDRPRDALVAEFDALQDEQIALVRDADGLPIDRVRIVSPFDARARYSAYSALYTLPRHQHRHIEQAEEAL